MTVDSAPPPEPKSRADFVKCKYLVHSILEISQLNPNLIQLILKNIYIFFLQTSASWNWTIAQPIRSCTSLKTAEKSSAQGTCSPTMTTQRGLTALPRCCAERACLEAASTGRLSGAGSSPSVWPTRASAERAKAHCVCWATTTNPGVYSVPRQVTLPGTTGWTNQSTAPIPPG